MTNQERLTSAKDFLRLGMTYTADHQIRLAIRHGARMPEVRAAFTNDEWLKLRAYEQRQRRAVAQIGQP